jgi:hypothetical protein
VVARPAGVLAGMLDATGGSFDLPISSGSSRAPADPVAAFISGVFFSFFSFLLAFAEPAATIVSSCLLDFGIF